MKLLSVLVSIIAAISTNSRNLPDVEPKYLGQQDQLLKDTAISAVGERDLQEENQHLNKIHTETLGVNYWNSAVKHRALGESCEDADGKCMPKRKIHRNCNGKVDKSLTCENNKEACCISDINQCMAEVGGHSVLWEQIQSGDLLLKKNINEGNDNITIDIDFKFSTLEIKMENITKELDHMKQQLDYIIQILNNSAPTTTTTECLTTTTTEEPTTTTTTEPTTTTTTPTTTTTEYLTTKTTGEPTTTTTAESTTTTTIECSEADGFFMFTGEQCFKMFKDARRPWSDAKSLCEANSLRLAEPLDSTAAGLRKYLLDTYGSSSWTWIGAQGDGSYISWLSNGKHIEPNNSLWHPSHGSQSSSSYCLGMEVATSNTNSYPLKPYCDWACSRSYYPLCQKV